MPTPLTDAEATDQFLRYLGRRGVRLERSARGRLVPVAVGGIPLTPALRAEIARRRDSLLPFAAPRRNRP